MKTMLSEAPAASAHANVEQIYAALGCTKDFARTIPSIAVREGLVERGAALVGVVLNPDRVFWGFASGQKEGQKKRFVDFHFSSIGAANYMALRCL